MLAASSDSDAVSLQALQSDARDIVAISGLRHVSQVEWLGRAAVLFNVLVLSAMLVDLLEVLVEDSNRDETSISMVKLHQMLQWVNLLPLLDIVVVFAALVILVNSAPTPKGNCGFSCACLPWSLMLLGLVSFVVAMYHLFMDFEGVSQFIRLLVQVVDGSSLTLLGFYWLRRIKRDSLGDVAAPLTGGVGGAAACHCSSM
eukprot:gnl/TRDRNA2_/TRDRNA2_174252_c0_seq14.p1 gnl/TRDRNA2_/TRDRNA2_174252_c0~~gnl/TRDRNA2_/TRDRNA2_174252_c0_seq14.p1  ORF type:complete len:201 (-),score=31.14 gnl/TRDRNA2_/TRDRNA2_174252_c0_seq14:31-633(-)